MRSGVMIQSNGTKMKLFKNINLEKLKNGLAKTRHKLVDRIAETVTGKVRLDEDVLGELEEILLSSDVGYDIAEQIIERAKLSIKEKKGRDTEAIVETIKEELSAVLLSNLGEEYDLDKISNSKPFVILIVGVNGSGKTTTIGKLANIYKKSGLKVLIGSADTFRAAANEQLEIWADRAGVDIVKKESGADPSSVAFDTLNIAKKMNADVVLIDTAGRLHTKQNLMEELSKIKRVMRKVVDNAPNDVFLVLDGNTGQNAILQAKEFSKHTDLTGLIITKLDGTAKGGVLFQISTELAVPIKYIGVGEGIDDLQTFEPEIFIDALFN